MTHQRPRAEHYRKIQAGIGTVMKGQLARTGDYFDVTLRNTQHPFHSKGVRQERFNDVRYNDLKERSRFQGEQAKDRGPMSPEPASSRNLIDEGLFFDIKGNTYKNTLIPGETAQNAFAGGTVG
jgi:hypothetical protein